MRLYRQTLMGKRAPSRCTLEADSFAEAAILQSGVFPVTAVVVDEAKLLVIEAEPFLHHLQADPKLCLNMMASMSIHLRRLVQQVEQLTLRSSTPAGRNWRNLPMPVVLGGLLVANALMHADAVGLAATGPLGQRLGIGIVILLIGLVGGRIIPSFTLNWLKKRGELNLPASFGALDRGALGLTATALAIWWSSPKVPSAGQR